MASPINVRLAGRTKIALAFIALVLGSGVRAGAAVPEDFATVLPPGAVAYAEVKNLGKLIERVEASDYLATVLASPQAQKLQENPEYRKAQAARVVAERQLGSDPVAVFRKLAGRSVAAALYPNPENKQQPHFAGLLSAEPGALAQLRKQLDPLLGLAGDAIKTSTGPHGTELFSIGDKAFVAWKDDWLAVATKRELVNEVIERLHGSSKGGLAEDASFVAMRQAIGKTPAGGAPAGAIRLLQAYVNVAMINQAAGGRLLPAKLDNPAASLLLGDSFEMVARSPYASLTLDVGDRGFVVALGVADSHAAAGASHQAFFPPENKPAAAPLPDVPGRIAGFTVYRDLADWYVHREQLLDEKALPGFDQFESGIANILPGRDFGQDILPMIGKRLTLVTAPQDFSHLDAPPGIRLPGFAAIIELARPDEGADLLQLLFQMVTAIGNLNAGQQGRQPWVMTSETYQGVQVAYAKYSKKPKGESLGIVYNLLPAAARVDDHFIVSSSLSLCRQIVDQLKRPKAPAEGLARTLDAQVRFEPLSGMIAANREFFLGRLVQEGRTTEQAGAEFDMLIKVLERFDAIRLSTSPGPGIYQVRLEGTWK